MAAGAAAFQMSSGPVDHRRSTSPSRRSVGGADAVGEVAAWARLLGEPTDTLNRKVWEWAYTLEVFEQLGVLGPGRRALGFGCGQQAILAVLASRGVEVVATDQPPEDATAWISSGQHSESIAGLRRAEICNDDLLASVRFSFRRRRHAVDPGGSRWFRCALVFLCVRAPRIDSGWAGLRARLDALRQTGRSSRAHDGARRRRQRAGGRPRSGCALSPQGSRGAGTRAATSRLRRPVQLQPSG